MPADETQPVATILLAAGESRRMGTQKQLLLINGKPMVRVAAEHVRQVSTGALIVVVGSNGEEITRALDGLDAHCVTNPEWTEGMGASLRHGMRSLAQTAPEAAAVLIMLADQPGIPSAHLASLLDRHRVHPTQIIATENNGIAQPPAIFPRAWFEQLGALQGDRGARAILRDSAHEVHLVHTASIDDVDTPADYENFLKRSAG